MTGVDDLERIMSQIEEGGDLLVRLERVTRGSSNFLWIPVELK